MNAAAIYSTDQHPSEKPFWDATGNLDPVTLREMAMQFLMGTFKTVLEFIGGYETPETRVIENGRHVATIVVTELAA